MIRNFGNRIAEFLGLSPGKKRRREQSKPPGGDQTTSQPALKRPRAASTASVPSAKPRTVHAPPQRWLSTSSFNVGTPAIQSTRSNRAMGRRPRTVAARRHVNFPPQLTHRMGSEGVQSRGHAARRLPWRADGTPSLDLSRVREQHRQAEVMQRATRQRSDYTLLSYRQRVQSVVRHQQSRATQKSRVRTEQLNWYGIDTTTEQLPQLNENEQHSRSVAALASLRRLSQVQRVKQANAVTAATSSALGFGGFSVASIGSLGSPICASPSSSRSLNEHASSSAAGFSFDIDASMRDFNASSTEENAALCEPMGDTESVSLDQYPRGENREMLRTGGKAESSKIASGFAALGTEISMERNDDDGEDHAGYSFGAAIASSEMDTVVEGAKMESDEEEERLMEEAQTQMEDLEQGYLDGQPLGPDGERISPQDENDVQEAWDVAGSEDEVLVQAFNLELMRKDIRTLAEQQWLNDEVINFYVALLNSELKAHAARDEGAQPRVFAFNSFFYAKLFANEQYNYNGVRRWTKKKKVDVLVHDKILVPVNLENTHWVFAVVNMRDERFEFYDPQVLPVNLERTCPFLKLTALRLHVFPRLENDGCSSGPQVVENLRRWIVDEVANKNNGKVLDVTNWQCFIAKPEHDIPRQLNGSDCGVFALKFMETVGFDRNVEFDQRHMAYFRRKITLALLRKVM